MSGRDPCTADLGSPCDCARCDAEECQMRAEWEAASPEERDPARYRREIRDAGRGRLIKESE